MVHRQLTVEVLPNHFSRFGVNLSEDDVLRLITEHFPGLQPHELSTRDTFMLIELEAEILLTWGRIARFKVKEQEEEKARLQSLEGQRAQLIARIKEKHGGD